MNYYRVFRFTLASVLAGLFAPLPVHATTLPEHCSQLHQNFSLQAAAIDEGLFRYANSDQDYPQWPWSTFQNFTDYVKYSQQLINARHPYAKLRCGPQALQTSATNALASAAERPELTTVADWLSPYEMVANPEKVVVLVHGLTDSPFLFNDIAQQLFTNGWSVRTVLLPGHGTAPADLTEVELQDWRDAVNFAVNQAQRDYPQVWLGGVSTGGALLMDYVYRHQQPEQLRGIAGLLLWSPATQAQSSQAWLAEYLDYLPFFTWLDKAADTDFAKYESFPVHAAALVQELMIELASQQSEQRWPALPVLIHASADDQTIDSSVTRRWFDAMQQQAPRSTLYWYLAHSAQVSANEVTESGVVLQRCQSVSCAAVDDFAHTSLAAAPRNWHYGEYGYRNCSHYLSDEALFKACKTSANNRLGEVTESALANASATAPLQRLTFNPEFQQMISSVLRFLRQSP